MANQPKPSRPAAAAAAGSNPRGPTFAFAPAAVGPDAGALPYGSIEYHFAPWDDAGPLYDEHARVVVGASTQFYIGPVEFAGSGKWGWVPEPKR